MVEKSTDKDLSEGNQNEEQKNAHELIALDQTKQNVPIDPELDDMLELLEHKMKQLKLESPQCELLKEGLKSQRFSKSAQLVAN